MNPTASPESKSRRRLGWWIALVLGLMVIPPVVLGVGIFSMLRLDRDAAALKREVMAASDTGWHTKVQLSVGWLALGAVRTGLHFINHEHMDEARQALKSVRSVSVGVYESNARNANISRGQLFARADELMNRRGWTRLVGVAEDNETVLIYTSNDLGSGNRIDLCLAVLDRNELVVVSTNVDASALAELAEMHLPKGGLRAELKRKNLSL
jgi:hypothetical protein